MAKRIWPKFKRWPLGILILLFVLVAQRSSYERVFTEIQRPTATWEVTNVRNNRIGDAMKAKLVIVTSQGMEINLSRIPEAGDVWDLPDTERYTSPPGSRESRSIIDEGKVEVRSREIKQFYKGDKVYTVITYELQYLLPLDWEVAYDDKRLPYFVPVSIRYWYYDVKTQRLDKRMALLEYKIETIYLYRRVDENSTPMFTLYEMPAPESPWRHGVTLGFGLIGLAAALIVRKSILLLDRSLRELKSDTRPDRSPTVADYFESWQKEPRYETFIKAVLLFNKFHREKDSLWWRTMVVLYSGKVFDEKQIRNIFEAMLKEE